MSKDNKTFDQLLTEIRMSLDTPSMTVESLLFPEEHEEAQVSAQEEPLPGGGEEEVLSAEVEQDPTLGAPKADLSQAVRAVAEIRKISMNALVSLAEHPNTEEYTMLKKIWMMCDKAAEGGEESKKNNAPA